MRTALPVSLSLSLSVLLSGAVLSAATSTNAQAQNCFMPVPVHPSERLCRCTGLSDNPCSAFSLYVYGYSDCRDAFGGAMGQQNARFAQYGTQESIVGYWYPCVQVPDWLKIMDCAIESAACLAPCVILKALPACLVCLVSVGADCRMCDLVGCQEILPQPNPYYAGNVCFLSGPVCFGRRGLPGGGSNPPRPRDGNGVFPGFPTMPAPGDGDHMKHPPLPQ